MKSSTKLTALAAAALVGALALAPASSAQVRQRTATVSNSAGRTATATTTITNNDLARTRDRSVETGQGYGYSHNSTAGYDPETGSRYREGQTTTNSGATASHSTQADCNSEGCQRSTALTGPNGETAYRDVTRNGEGTKTTTVTGADGETHSRTRWITVD